MARAAAAGSGAARIGRAITRWSAPAASASAGVAMRFWSWAAAPAGRTPGVTMSRPAAPGRARIAAASRGEAITPSAPAAKARAARSTTSVFDLAVADQRGVEVGAVERGEQGHGEDAGGGGAAAGDGGADHMRVAVDREEVGGEGGEAADRRLDGGGDVEELEVEEDPLAQGFQLGGEIEAAGGEHAEADLVEADLRAEPGHHRARRGGVGKVEADDQPHVRHSPSPACFRRRSACAAGRCQEAAAQALERPRARPHI